jgi:arabinan endo-1,5-alpha-L-arabinosidase
LWFAGGIFTPPRAGEYEPLLLEGQTFIHDPSTILKEQERYFVFGTGWGVAGKWSPDLVHWTNAPAVFKSRPAWTTNAVATYRGYAWAPDVVRLNGRYCLYYSVSSFGKQVSAIGLATSSFLNNTSADSAWTDQGPVICSTNGSPYNAIDPSVMLDLDGKLWMAFGSFWKGVHLLQLNPETGLSLDNNLPPRPVAWSESIEAACLTRHGKFYYLFVNWGACCRGTNSTYQVCVGRSAHVQGPYADRAGIDLINGGGTPFLESSGRFVGPGHIGILSDAGRDWFSYHYYDADDRGRSRLALGRLVWTEDGWPSPRSPRVEDLPVPN